MNESPNPRADKSSDQPVEQIRTQEPKAPAGADEPNPNVVSDQTTGDQGAGEDAEPGLGGYAERDPKTDMPRIPSAPETQDDPKSHDAAPDRDREHWAGE